MQEAVKVEPSEPPKRYHPLLVTLHWLIVLLVFTDLYLGLFVFKPLIQEGGALRIPSPSQTPQATQQKGSGTQVRPIRTRGPCPNSPPRVAK